jgi:hypothetical protein
MPCQAAVQHNVEYMPEWPIVTLHCPKFVQCSLGVFLYLSVFQLHLLLHAFARYLRHCRWRRQFTATYCVGHVDVMRACSAEAVQWLRSLNELTHLSITNTCHAGESNESSPRQLPMALFSALQHLKVQCSRSCRVRSVAASMCIISALIPVDSVVHHRVLQTVVCSEGIWMRPCAGAGNT